MPGMATQTVSTTLQVHKQLPSKLDPGLIHHFEKISRAQAGHLRHFHNLSSLPDGEWSHMGCQDPGQEWVDAYRYQLATMAYAAGTAHYFRLPVLRSVFKTLFEQLIHKMMRREVWGYWFNTSHSGKFVDPDLKELRKPWPDPVARENIMYSGHLLLMVSLHAMLFNDDKYNEPDALVFNWNPLFWGMGPEIFSYNLSSLEQAILDELDREKWIGVCCEPNSVFVVCNQFPIIAMRYNDVRNGTNRVPNILQKYTAAWERKHGMIQEDGLFYEWYRPKQNDKVPTINIDNTAWACCFMNTWNSDKVHAAFPRQALGYLSMVSGDRVNLNTTAVARAVRKLVEAEGADPESPSTLQKARELAASMGVPRFHYPRPTFGYVAKWLSEVAEKSITDGLLNHADQFLHPRWDHGGLYYARNDQETDADGNWTLVEPFTGNAAIGFARLNVQNGQKEMFEKPWTAEYVAHRPYVDGVSLGSGVDFLRGSWDDNLEVMVLTARTWDGKKKSIRPVCCNFPLGQYGIYINGELSKLEKIEKSSDTIELALEVDGQELDVVLLKARVI